MIDCFHYTAEDGIKIISKIKISYAVVKNAVVNGLKLILLFFRCSVVEWLAPEHGLLGYGRMTILKKAATGQSTMETCKKYRCNPPPSVQYN